VLQAAEGLGARGAALALALVRDAEQHSLSAVEMQSVYEQAQAVCTAVGAADAAQSMAAAAAGASR
jgi:hypothetical protein